MEIIADAKRHADRALGHARRQSEELRNKGRAQVEQETRDRLEAARRQADSRRELILAGVAIEAARRRSARIESALGGVLDEARQRLLAHQGFDYREALARLAAEAVSRMAGTNFVLQLSGADRAALGDGLAEDVRRRVGCEGLQVTVAAEAAKIDGGVIVRDAEGRQVWDNSLRARLDRFWPILRREIGVRTSLAGRSAEKES
jgi:vacuolar-type H+-ATPase subunit E/Vma4